MSVRARAAIVGVIASVAWAACRTAPDTQSSALPLGPGPVIRFAAAGTVAARPSVAVRGRNVAVAWTATFAGTTTVSVATSGDGGRTFRAPVRVATGSASAIDAREPPRLFFERGGAAAPLVVEWTERAGALDVARYAQSTNGGVTFAPDRPDAVRLVYTGASAEDPEIPEAVLAALDARNAAHRRGVVDADGTLVLVWDESHGTNRRIAMQRVVFGGDGSFTRLSTMPVTTWGANARPAIAATSGGVIVAWIDERGGRATVGLRAVGLETLCTDPRAAAPDSLNFEWTPWPSRSRALAHHD